MAPSIDGPYTQNATHNLLFSPAGATLWIDNSTGIYHGLFGTTIDSSPFGAGTHCWSKDGLIWEGQDSMPSYTGRVEWAGDAPHGTSQSAVLAWRGLPRVLLDGEPGSSYGSPRVLFTGAADCIGKLDNETGGEGVQCKMLAGSRAGSAAAFGTTRTYTALEELLC